MSETDYLYERIATARSAIGAVKLDWIRKKHGLDNKLEWLDRLESGLDIRDSLSEKQMKTLDNICHELRVAKILKEEAGEAVSRGEKKASEKLKIALDVLRLIFYEGDEDSKDLAKQALREMGEPAFTMKKGEKE